MQRGRWVTGMSPIELSLLCLCLSLVLLIIHSQSIFPFQCPIIYSKYEGSSFCVCGCLIACDAKKKSQKWGFKVVKQTEDEEQIW